MKRVVAIDGHNLALQRGTGVATYAKNLADNIKEAGWDSWSLYGGPISASQTPLMREISFFDYLGGTAPKKGWVSDAYAQTKELFRAPLGYKVIDIPTTGKVEARRFAGRLPEESKIFNVENLFNVSRRYFKKYNKFLRVRFSEPPDVMHWTYPLPIKVVGVPNIYTIHDLVPLRLPYTTLDNKRYYHRLIKGCIENGKHICTVSEKSKEDILRLFEVPESKITNTYQSVETSLVAGTKSQSEAELEVAGIYGLAPQSYFLFFGAIEPKKNVARLIEAFLSARLDAKLVIVGAMAWKSGEEMKLLDSMLKQRAGLSERIQVFDYAPRPFLLSLIRAAKAVVFPSLYEGFGLPILEAMQLGVPTLCSTEGSLPEVAGNASVYVDPYDVAAIARGLKILDQDHEVRRQLTLAGAERAMIFDAQSYRTRLMNMYEKVM
ncbi:glycosyltransferase family 1 protein [Paraburkholderia bryophila]|uniref:glycosyltransferase family 4 protein n=1 Tax=Burkholderiaceae TaxID=119060 RepID=UPI00055782E8|nr:glycosyltransferase family 1 protein [Burkholderia sp. 9120]